MGTTCSNCKPRNYGQQDNYTEIFYILLLKCSFVIFCIAYIWKLKVFKINDHLCNIREACIGIEAYFF